MVLLIMMMVACIANLICTGALSDRMSAMVLYLRRLGSRGAATKGGIDRTNTNKTNYTYVHIISSFTYNCKYHRGRWPGASKETGNDNGQALWLRHKGRHAGAVRQPKPE